MGRSKATIAKDTARSRQWAKDNKAHINTARRASRAKARPEMTLAELSADSQYQNWLALEERIRTVVAAAIVNGTIERGSPWYECRDVEEYLATPLRPYIPMSRTTRLAPR